MRKVESKSLKIVVLLVLILSLLLTFMFSANWVCESAMAIEEPKLEVKTYSKTTLEDDFSDDKVIIVLSKDATRQFITYTPNDFPEVDCISIEDLTAFTVDWVKEQVNGEKTEEKMLVNIDKFRRILSLELREKSKENILKAVRILEKRDDVVSANPNARHTISAQPNDAMITDQWGLTKINASTAWDIYTGTNTVTVGVLDTGINGSHQDLTNRIHRYDPHTFENTLHRDFTSGSQVGVSILYPHDENGHGTHVAGIIGAEGNNSIGVAGICWDVRLVSLRIFDADGSGDNVWLINAINYAASQNIPILNYSGGGPSYSNDLQEAITAYDGLFVCAAGNDDNNNDTTSVYPASYPSDNIISVGSSDTNDNRSNWNGFDNLWGLFGSSKSNYGQTSVDLFAPGTDILSTVPGNKYKSKSGTSMAAPMVTGAAALLLSHNPNLTNAQLKSAILDNVDTVSALNGLCVTGGRLNVNNAIRSIGYTTNDLPDNKIEITGVCFTADSLEIPSQLNGRTVTQIGTSAFANQSMNEIIIPSNVTSIGTSAFANCINLSSVDIPCVNSIGESAFENCTNLINVDIPFSVTSIGYNAFGGCNNLESITVPFVGETLNGTTNNLFRYIFGDTVPPSLETVIITGGNSIAFGAFAYCTGITSIEIPASVTSIGTSVFYDCTSLTNIIVNSNNLNYSSQGGILYDKTKTLIIHVPHAISGMVTLPNGITNIPNYAFEDRTQLLGISSPNNVTSIGNNAFYGCIGLADISILNGVNSIGLYTFWGCTGLTNITIPSSVTNIEASAFVHCSGLLSVTIPSSVTSIGGFAFANCDQLETVNVLRHTNLGITALGQNAFAECPALTEICVPDASYKTASNWSTYSSIIFADNGTNGLAYTLIDNGTAYSVSKGSATANSVLIPDRYLGVKVTEISDNGFSNYSNMTGITISTIITNIGSYAFSNCEALTSITIPSNVTSIGSHAFYNCTGLSNVTISSGITSIANNTFANCSSLTNISIPISVTSIGESAFSSCSALTNFTIPTSINSIGNNAFSNCNNLKIVNIIRPLALGVIALGGTAAFGGTTALYAIYVPDTESQTAYRATAYWSNYSSVIFADNGTPGLAYTLINGNTAYSVTRGTATANNIIILPTYNNLPVTAIGNSGFYNRPTLISITIPNRR